MDVTRRKVAAVKLSILSSSCLIVLKIIVGVVTHSVGILADAIHSAADVFAALVALFAVRVSGEPPDDTHPYGHGKFESISGLVEALFIFAAAMVVMREAIRRLILQSPIEQIGWGLALMAFSATVNIFVSRHLYRVAHETESIALRADAANLRSDVYASIAVFGGLTLVYVTGNPIFDPLVALGVALVVVRMAIGLMRPALDMLLDTRLPEEEIRRLEAVLRSDPRVYGFHKLRSRRAGPRRLVDLHLEVSDDLTFSEAHRLTEEVEERLRQELPNTDVLVHTEPHHEEAQHQAEAHRSEEDE
jgi:cation diffusion facilitator family transporter